MDESAAAPANITTSPHADKQHRRQSKTVAQLLEHLGSRKSGPGSLDELNNNHSPDDKRLVIDTDALDDSMDAVVSPPVVEQKKVVTSPRTINKKFSCRLCGKRFVHRQNLFAHENTHTGERPFRCIFCNKGFKCPSTLCKHKRCMHPAEMAKISPERRLGDTSIKHISLAREKRAINAEGCFEYPIARTVDMSPTPGNENDSAHINILNGLSSSYSKNFDHVSESAHKTKKIKKEENSTHLSENKGFLFSGQNVQMSPIDQKPSWLAATSEPVHNKAPVENNTSSRRKRSLSPDADHPLPYQCHVCYKKFANSNSLNQHKYTHATDRSIQCNVCGRMFKHPGAMYRHRRTVHTEPALQQAPSPASQDDKMVAQQLAQHQLVAASLQASMHGISMPPNPLGLTGLRLPTINVNAGAHQAFPADALALRDAYFTSSVAAAHIPQQFYMAQAAAMQAALTRQPPMSATHKSPDQNDENAPPKQEDDGPLNLVKPKEMSESPDSEEPNRNLSSSIEWNNRSCENTNESTSQTRQSSSDTEMEAVTVRDRRKNTYPRKYLVPKATALTSDEESGSDHGDDVIPNDTAKVSELHDSGETCDNNNKDVTPTSQEPKDSVLDFPENASLEATSLCVADDVSGCHGIKFGKDEGHTGVAAPTPEAETKDRICTPNSIEVSSSCLPLHVETQTEHINADDDEFEDMLSHWFSKRKLFECPHCKIIFREFSIFAMHFGMHVSSNPLQCSFCGRHCKDKFEFLCHHS